ncbi:LexA family transcriptional regulator [Megalodesulfovibrio paquesii]
MPGFEEIFDRIKVATNTRTQVELAEVLDIRQSSISDAKRRDSVPSDWYLKLFEKYGLNPDWLKSGLGPMYLKSEQGYEPYDGPQAASLREEAAKYAEPDSKAQIVTVFGMQGIDAATGKWMPKSIGKLSIPLSLARTSITVVKMDASSMEPLIRRGAYVGLDTDQKNILSGELYGVFIPFEGLGIRRIFLDEEKGRFVLRTENPDHPEQYLPVEKRDERVVGRAVWVLQQL